MMVVVVPPEESLLGVERTKMVGIQGHRLATATIVVVTIAAVAPRENMG
jgi:hypothetical protein